MVADTEQKVGDEILIFNGRQSIFEVIGLGVIIKATTMHETFKRV